MIYKKNLLLLNIFVTVVKLLYIFLKGPTMMSF